LNNTGDIARLIAEQVHVRILDIGEACAIAFTKRPGQQHPPSTESPGLARERPDKAKQ
jgi:hypothetical protein